MSEPKVEILHSRDPDGGCYISVWVDGKEVRYVEESSDPGYGHLREDWVHGIESTLRAEDYSDAFRAAALMAQQGDGKWSKYVEGSYEEYVAELCQEFVDTDEDARTWAEWDGTDPEDRETLDCDVISRRFIEWLEAREYPITGHLVHVHPPVETGEMYSHHWFVYLPAVDLAVDWTARQFWNVPPEGERPDPEDIDCPLVFDWPGEYPIEFVTFVEVADA